MQRVLELDPLRPLTPMRSARGATRLISDGIRLHGICMEASRPKQVVFVIAHLGPGGAQRVAATAANALVARGVDVHFFTLLDAPADAYALDQRVRRYALRASLRGAPEINGGDDLVDAANAEASATRADARTARGAFTSRFAKTWRRARFTLGLVQQVARLRKDIRRIGPNAVLSFLTQTNIMTLLATRGLNDLDRGVGAQRSAPAALEQACHAAAALALSTLRCRHRE